MSYYCNKCQKTHSIKYNTHKQFKSPEWGKDYQYDENGKKIPLTPIEEKGLLPTPIGIPIPLQKGGIIKKWRPHDHLAIAGLPTLIKIDTGITLEKLAFEISEIKKTLRAWGSFMDRHVPNWRKSGHWTKWAWNEIIAKDKDSVIRDDD